MDHLLSLVRRSYPSATVLGAIFEPNLSATSTTSATARTRRTLDPVFTGPEIVIGAIVVVTAAALQGSIGFGFAVLSVPILTLVDPAFTPIPMLLLALPLAVFGLIRERSDVDWSGLGWIVAGRLPGAFLGAWVLGVASERLLRLLIGSIVLIVIALLAWGITVRITRSSRFIAGLISGFSGASSAIGGPPLALLYRRQQGPTVRSTLGTIFTIGVTINIVALASTGVMTSTDIQTAVLLSPAMIVGFLVSSKVKHLAEGERLTQGIMIVSAAAALGLLASSI